MNRRIFRPSLFLSLSLSRRGWKITDGCIAPGELLDRGETRRGAKEREKERKKRRMEGEWWEGMKRHGRYVGEFFVSCNNPNVHAGWLFPLYLRPLYVRNYLAGEANNHGGLLESVWKTIPFNLYRSRIIFFFFWFHNFHASQRNPCAFGSNFIFLFFFHIIFVLPIYIFIWEKEIYHIWTNESPDNGNRELTEFPFIKIQKGIDWPERRKLRVKLKFLKILKIS